MSKSELPRADEPRPDRCETCRFSEDHDTISRCEDGSPVPPEDRSYSCMRYPPTRYDDDPDSGRYGMGLWLDVAWDDWCGEWQAKARTTDDMPTEELVKIRDDALRAIGPDSETAKIMDRIIRERGGM